jgi:hypothetical protein
VATACRAWAALWAASVLSCEARPPRVSTSSLWQSLIERWASRGCLGGAAGPPLY